MNPIHRALGVSVAVAVVVHVALGEGTYYTNFDTWKAQVPSVTSLDFQDLPNGDWLSSQYLSQGINFTDGGMKEQSGIYGLDGHGIYCGCKLELVFDQPILALASHHPGNVRFVLFSGDDVVYFGPSLGSGPLNFHGVISTVTFDRAWIMGDTLGPPVCDVTLVDNIYFQSIPGPAPIAIWIVGGIIGAGRRRR